MGIEKAKATVERWEASPHQRNFDYSFENVFRAAEYFEANGEQLRQEAAMGILESLSERFDSAPWISNMDVRRIETAIAKKWVKKEFSARLVIGLAKAKQLNSYYQTAADAFGEIQDRYYLEMNWQLVWKAYFTLNDGIEPGKAAFRKDYGKILDKEAWARANENPSMGNMHPIFRTENIDKLKFAINEGYVTAKHLYEKTGSRNGAN